MKNTHLAILGGSPIRVKPLPYRALFGKEELKAVERVFHNSWENEQDFGYQEKFEDEYTSAFCSFQGGGFADAVCSGSIAVYLAILALQIEAKSEVIVSPVTDPGCISAVILAGYTPVLADSAPHQFNVGVEQFENAITKKTRGAVLTHTGGIPMEVGSIMEIARKYNIKVVEDCSQAHGAFYKNKRVGSFGDIAAFSTMFSKGHATGGCGGIVYTSNEDYYWSVRSLSDRGKPFFEKKFDTKDPSEFLYPALNFNQNELSCAIGLTTLAKLPEMIDKRLQIAKKIDAGLKKNSSAVSPSYIESSNSQPSFFFHTVKVDTNKLNVNKKEFAQSIAAEGVWINPDYRYVVSEWKWMQERYKFNNETPNAIDHRNNTFNILFNENFSDLDIQDIVNSIIKVEEYYTQ